MEEAATATGGGNGGGGGGGGDGDGGGGGDAAAMAAMAAMAAAMAEMAAAMAAMAATALAREVVRVEAAMAAGEGGGGDGGETMAVAAAVVVAVGGRWRRRLWQLYETCMVKPLPDGAPVAAIILTRWRLGGCAAPARRVITRRWRSSRRRGFAAAMAALIRVRLWQLHETCCPTVRPTTPRGVAPNDDRTVGFPRGKGPERRVDFNKAAAGGCAGAAVGGAPDRDRAVGCFSAQRRTESRRRR